MLFFFLPYHILQFLVTWQFSCQMRDVTLLPLLNEITQQLQASSRRAHNIHTGQWQRSLRHMFQLSHWELCWFLLSLISFLFLNSFPVFKVVIVASGLSDRLLMNSVAVNFADFPRPQLQCDRNLSPLSHFLGAFPTVSLITLLFLLLLIWLRKKIEWGKKSEGMTQINLVLWELELKPRRWVDASQVWSALISVRGRWQQRACGVSVWTIWIPHLLFNFSCSVKLVFYFKVLCLEIFLTTPVMTWMWLPLVLTKACYTNSTLTGYA